MKTIGQQIHGKFNGRSRVLLLAAAAGMALAAPAFAQNRDWLGGSGNWGTATSWNPADVPNTFAETATIGVAGTYTLTMSSGVSLGAFSITNPTAALELVGGQTLNLAGSSTNNGVVRINPGSINADTHITVINSLTLGGTGVLRLNYNGNFATAYLIDNGGGQVLTNGAGHTIAGGGRINSNFANNGIVLADVVGSTLDLNSATKTNDNLMQANAGATLSLNATTLNQGAPGQLIANGGVVTICGSNVNGGTIIGQSGGAVQVVCGSQINSAHTLGTLQVMGGNELGIAASLTNDGTITVNPASINADTHIKALNSMSFGGSGTVVLTSNGNHATSYIIDNGGGQVTTNGPSHTIRGTGAIYSNFTNNGTVLANVNGAVLQLNSATKINNSTMTATASGFLDFVSTTLDQSGGGTTTANGGTVRLSGATVIGGSLNAIAGGVTQVTNGSAQLRGTTVNGPFEIAASYELAANAAGITNNGVITMNSGAGNADTHFKALDSLVIGGSGQMILNSNGNLQTAYLVDNGGGQVTTNGTNHTIRGTGRIYSNFNNNGVVNADRPAATLQLNGGSKTNNNLMTATGGGNLDFEATVVSQGSGVIRANGGSVTFGGTTVNGGVIEAINGSRTTTRASSQFNNLTFNGPHDVNASLEMATASGFTNNGVITINTTAGNADTHFKAFNNLVINGTGQMVLNSNGNLVTAYLVDNGGGQTTTNASTHTIRGTGRIYSNFNNNGLVNADRNGETLQLTGSTKTNNGLMTATGGGNLDFDATTVNQGTGVIRADGGTVSFGGATVNGGVIEAINGSRTSTRASSQFNLLTLSGPHDVNASIELATASGFTNNGVITINTTAGNVDTHFKVLNNVTVGGSGKIVLNCNGNLNTSYLTDNGGGQVMTNGLGHTIAGYGRTFSRINNNGIIAPGNGAAHVGQIDLQAVVTCSATSVLDFDIVGPGNNAANFDRITGAAAFTLDGTLRVHTTGYTPGLGETFLIISAGTRTGTFAFVDAKGYRVDYLPNGVRLTAICETDLNEDGNSDQDDVAYLINVIGGGANPLNIDPDFNRDGNSDQDDIAALINAIAGGGC